MTRDTKQYSKRTKPIFDHEDEVIASALQPEPGLLGWQELAAELATQGYY